MSDPKNHHWLPRFLSREWASGNAKKVIYFHRPHSRAVSSWKGTRKIGSAEWLYTVRRAGYKDPNFVETSFMTKVIDTPAAQIHRRMLNGEVEAFGFAERERWSCFMLLLRVRHPEMIRLMQEAEEEIPKKAWVESLIGEIPKGYVQPLDQAGAEAFYDQHMAGSGRDLALQVVVDWPRNNPFFNQIMSLEWRVLRLNSAPIGFLLADNPVMMWGKDSFIERIWMTLSPDALFVAGDHQYLSQDPRLREEFREILPIEVMRYQFQQAREFVIGKDQGAEKNQVLLGRAEEYLRKCNGIDNLRNGISIL